MHKKLTKKRIRKIAVLSGKRGGFGALITLMQAIDADPGLKLELIVTDMHLSPLFGNTVIEVEKWFKKPHRVDLKQVNDSASARSNALGRCVIEMTKVLSKIKPDILVTIGDRGEVLSSCIAAMELNIPIAHILGGDVVGNRDGNRIHSITKLANLHFPSSKDSYKRILRLGEEPWQIFSYGSTYIDLVVEKKFTPNIEVRKKYGLDSDEEYIICIQHPMTLQEDRSYAEMNALLMALKKIKTKTIIVYPCSDQGYKGILRSIDKHCNTKQFSVHKNIEAVDFWGLMDGASLFIGNSSSGLMETPYFNLPSVTIGHRQDGRVRDNNVIISDPTTSAIIKAVNKARSLQFRKKIKNNYVFGKGNAGVKIAKILKTISLDEKLLMKKITF